MEQSSCSLIPHIVSNVSDIYCIPISRVAFPFQSILIAFIIIQKHFRYEYMLYHIIVLTFSGFSWILSHYVHGWECKWYPKSGKYMFLCGTMLCFLLKHIFDITIIGVFLQHTMPMLNEVCLGGDRDTRSAYGIMIYKIFSERNM